MTEQHVLNADDREALINQIADSWLNKQRSQGIMSAQYEVQGWKDELHTYDNENLIATWENATGQVFNNSTYYSGYIGEDDLAESNLNDINLAIDANQSYSGTTPIETKKQEDTKTEEQKASDERIETQCMLIDFLPTIASYNYSWRANQANSGYQISQATGGGGFINPFMRGMWGDGEQFSSNVHGSALKSKFLDFTTPQLSSLVPVLKLYKIKQNDKGDNKDYLIPFPTHAGWIGDKSVSVNNKSWKLDTTLNYDTIEIDIDTPINVGIKSFNWEFQGTNPVSSKADIKAEFVLYAKSLTDLISPFNIQSTDGCETAIFKYVDLILRSGKKFQENKQYNPDYYRIKVEIGWKTGNKQLFSDDELKALDANTSVMILTLIDHQFDFDQDGSVQLKMSYRAYFESIFAQESADMLRSSEDDSVVNGIKKEMYNLKEAIDSQQADSEEDDTNSSADNKSPEQQQYDELGKRYDGLIDDLNKRSFQRIIDSLTSINAIYYAQVDVEQYTTSKNNNESNIQGLILNPYTVDTTVAGKAKEAINGQADSNGNPNLNSLVPQTVDGKRNISFFYLGDLFYIVFYQIQKKTDVTNFPYFIFGSALYKKPDDINTLEYINILDIPVSVEWFSEWFTSTVISQDRETYQVLYFIRDICSKLVTNLMSNTCDKKGSLKYRNRLNTANFILKKENNSNVIYKQSPTKGDIAVNPELSEIVQEYSPLISEQIPYNDLQEYVAIYCQDRMAPKKVNYCEDINRGIYHFYFGKDRGLVKTIKFNRTQVVGLREANYARESNGLGLEQLMTPYEIDMTMVGNNLMYNGMMILIDPSGFGRRIGQTDDPKSISFQLKLGGYYVVHNVRNSLSVDGGLETVVKARWVGSGRKGPISVSEGEDTGNIYAANNPTYRSEQPPINTTGNSLQQVINESEQPLSSQPQKASVAIPSVFSEHRSKF